MTGRATFGDFSSAATTQLAHRAAPLTATSRRPSPQEVASQIREFSPPLASLLTVLDHYLADITTSFQGVPGHQLKLLGPWPRASIAAHDALRNARGQLRHLAESDTWPGPPPPPGSPGHRLAAAAVSLAAGRDLLHTHFRPGQYGARIARTEWAPVITSLPVTRALLNDIARWARQVAPHGAQLALTSIPLRASMLGDRASLNGACQWLWALAAAVGTAQREDPALASDTALLHAIPVHALQPRRLPTVGHAVSELCRGTVSSAERVRQAARAAAPQAVWSPQLTAESFTQAATCATVISHHCHVLLRSLATRASQHGSADLAERLTASAESAAQARAAWMTAARAWYHMKTDGRGTLTPTAAEAADLALWTGRLAYANPHWTLDLGPAHPARPPGVLAPEPGDLGDVLGAVHHASLTLTTLATTDYTQIATAGQAGRLLVTTRSLSESVNHPHPFARAPAHRVSALLAVYGDAGHASVQATTAISAIAADIRAPSTTLTSALIAADASLRPRSAAVPQRCKATATWQGKDQSGPVERILRQVGAIDRLLLDRATAIDGAARQLLSEVARDAAFGERGRVTADLSSDADAATLINDLLASGNPRAAVLLHAPASTATGRHADHRAARSEQPEAEP